MDQKLKFKSFIFDGIMGAYFLILLITQLTNIANLQESIFYLYHHNDQLNLVKSFSWFGIGFFLSGFVSYFLNSKEIKTLGGLIFESDFKKTQTNHYEHKYNQVWFWQIIIFLTVTVFISFKVTESSFLKLLDYDGFQGVIRLIGGLATPNFQLLPKAISAIITTIFMAFIATFLAIPIAFILSFLSAKNIMTSNVGFAIYILLRSLFNLIRSIEALIWAIIFSVWVGIGPFAGMLALMMHSIASLAKQYSEIIETVQEGPIEGIKSTGANNLQVIWFGIVPQVILPFISFTIYRWDINIRMATIVGLVGGGGIGTLFMQYSGQALWHEVGTIILVIAFVVWFMDTTSAYLREALK